MGEGTHSFAGKLHTWTRFGWVTNTVWHVTTAPTIYVYR